MFAPAGRSDRNFRATEVPGDRRSLESILGFAA